MSSQYLRTSLLSSTKWLASSLIAGQSRARLPLPPPARLASWTTRRDDKSQQRYGAFDPSLPFVEYETPNGTDRGNVIVSARTKPETLTAALSTLLGTSTRESFGTKSWQLSTRMNTINRFFSFANGGDATSFVEAVSAAADEMDHHPEIVKKNYEADTCVVISCSTHNPPGLSMRDVRLAKKIDDLAAPYGDEIYSSRDGESPKSVHQRRRRFLDRLKKPPKEAWQENASETPSADV